LAEIVRRVFDHVTIRVSDREASERFYDTVLATLGIEKTYSGEQGAEWNDFSLGEANAEKPVTRGLHVGFAASSRARVDQFWRAGTEAGYRDDGEPGPRPRYKADYYGGFLLDPDGNSVEAVDHAGVRPGEIQHLWLRVADVAASKRFYELVAEHASFRFNRVVDADPRRAQFVGGGSFSVVAGTPTENVHLAFPASDNATVDRFHVALTAAGYRDNGAPGERRIYHPGYYGAFVLDPDGNNVELVNHNR
jgi:catechol 2,3-dioxygenase-like lactoylglutathione lyase family enzyme